MKDVAIQDVISQFEEVLEQDDKIYDLNSQVKALKKDNSARFSDLAKDMETDAKTVRKAYKHWVEAKDEENPSEVDDDLYTLMASIDLYLEKED